MKGAAAAGGATLTVSSSATNEPGTITAKGTGILQVGNQSNTGEFFGSPIYFGYNTSWGMTITGAGSTYISNFDPFANGSTIHWVANDPADTGLNTGSNVPMYEFHNGNSRQHATGALALQSDFLIQGITDTFAGASTGTNMNNLEVDYKDCTTNCTATNENAIYVPTRAFAGTVTNGYGLNVTAPTGATNNYAANFAGDVKFTGTAPTVSTCGSGSLATGSSDHKGQITGITAATACTITFASALATAPACTFSNSAGTAVGISSISTAAVTTSMTALTGTLYYICF
jgi:hypothetical protein